MVYKKIDLELIVPADECDAVVAGLNAALDGLDEKHTLFGGGIETIDVKHRGARRRTALMHTLAAGETAADAVRAAGGKVAGALRGIL